MLAATVQQCACATGSSPLEQVDGPGIPDGWQCFRAYRPRHPADFGDIDDAFQALNPLPDAVIELSGGIASARSTWVFGAPPAIRILGAEPSPGELMIDGMAATQSADGGWTAPGWDSIGTHTIQFSGLSRSYEMARIEETWPNWTTAEGTTFSACGARVSAGNGIQALAVAGGAYWLLGAAAGEVAFTQQSASGISIAAPPFRPVWALPSLIARRRSPAMALAYRGSPRPPAANRSEAEILQWCNLLRGASTPRDADAKELWREFRTLARSLRRRRR